MDANVDEIARELAVLAQRFMDLGARLGEAAQALEEAGSPPADGLVEALGGARGRFVELRSQALSVADAAGVRPAIEPQSIHELEPLLEAIDEALKERARREALEQAKRDAVTTLDRVLELIHGDDPRFAALEACHAKARDTRAAVLALTELESETAREITASVRASGDLLAMVESRDALDDDQYARLEENVSSEFGRALAVAAARGRLGFEGDFPQPAPEAAVAEVAAPEPETADLDVVMPETAEASDVTASNLEPALVDLPTSEQPVDTDAEPEPALVVQALVEEPAAQPDGAADSSAPDETAQWWLAAWARWSGWKSTLEFASAVREELAKYPYLLSVPIRKSPEYEDGLLAYGYSILMDHVERQNPGCVGNALNSLKSGQKQPVGEQLYDYLITEGRLRETYPEFVKNTLLAAVPEPGVWFQFRILESREDTRILQRPSARLGDTELSGQRLATDGQRYNEHKFRMTLGPLTARFVLLSLDVKEPRAAGLRLVADGTPCDHAWVVTVATGTRPSPEPEARRVGDEGLHVTGLGGDQAALWIAVFNPDPAADRGYELSVFLRKDARSPFRTKG